VTRAFASAAIGEVPHPAAKPRDLPAAVTVYRRSHGR